MVRGSIPLAFGFGLLAVFVGPATADDRATCFDHSGKVKAPEKIVACGATIASGRLKDGPLGTAYNNRGNAYNTVKDYDRAITDLTLAMRLNPKDAISTTNRGLSYYFKHSYESALPDFNLALKLDVKYAAAWNGRALTRMALREYDAAIADFNEALRIEPKSVSNLISRGLAYADKRDYSAALRDYNQALAIDPRNTLALVRRASAYRFMNDKDRALADYNEAISINPLFSSALMGRGGFWTDRGDLDKALADYNEAIRIDPKSYNAYISRSTLLISKADYPGAIAAADQAIQLNPQFSAAFNNRGTALLEKGEIDRALNDLTESIRLDPKFANPYYNRGRVWRAKGEIARAINDFDEAIRLNSGLSRAYTQRGLTYEYKGDMDRARADFKAAVGGDVSNYIDRQAQDTARVRLSLLLNGDGSVSTVPVTRPPALQVGTVATGGDQGVRVALVIGNGGYKNANPLPNPVNDAHAVAKTLREIGFMVTEGTDLDHDGMTKLIRDFLRTAPSARIAVVFYAGHGMQVDGRNFLVPIDAKLTAPSDLNFETVDVDLILSGLNDEARANVIILDACRDNPLARSFASRSGATRSTAGSQGLAAYSSLGTGTLIAFATAPGQTALDGDGGNSPFTSALVHHLKTPGLEVRSMLTRVRADVVAATKAKQVPWDNSSLLGEVILAR